MSSVQTSPTVLVNGEVHPLPHEGITLAQFLETMDVDAPTSGVAVAVNDEVVRRQAWGERALHEGDRVEIVTAKQGG